VIKDAGDDPDVTDKAAITVNAAWAGPAVLASAAETLGHGGETIGDTGPKPNKAVVTIVAGSGVGTITLPGLGLAVGAPAVNPVPARMIRQAVGEVTNRPVQITISVPGGEEMAARTSNSRLGIVGGISILGTTGIVRPFSTAAWRASVAQQVQVAAAQGSTHLVLSTGGRSDAAAQRLYPHLPQVCFVEVGDFSGIALRKAASCGISDVTFVGMAGKIAKLAAGVMMTHYRRSKVDSALLVEVATACGASRQVIESASATATARHFAETCVDAGAFEVLNELCARAARACTQYMRAENASPDAENASPDATSSAARRPLKSSMSALRSAKVTVVMVDFDGEEVLARG
jgi:cobalt-precorrin-5B (C1)-methyltransferase